MAFDAHKNFAYSTVATAPIPAASGVSLVVQGGEGAKFPAPPFNAVVWPVGAQPLTTNAEIVRVTAIATDTFTITRTQESSSARTIVVGDQIAEAITVKIITDIEAALTPASSSFAFAPADPYQRFTVTDANVLATSKIIGAIRRPDVAGVDDPGWFYSYNVVKVANGSFDIVVVTSTFGGDPSDDLADQNDLAASFPPSVGSNNWGGLGTTTPPTREAMSFVAPARGGALTRLQLADVGLAAGAGSPDPAETVTLEIRDDNAGKPGNLLASAAFAAAGWPVATGPPIQGNSPLDWCLSSPVALVGGATYWWVLYRSQTSSDYPVVLKDGGGAYALPNAFSTNGGSTWVVGSADDFYFSITVAYETVGFIYHILN